MREFTIYFLLYIAAFCHFSSASAQNERSSLHEVVVSGPTSHLSKQQIENELKVSIEDLNQFPLGARTILISTQAKKSIDDINKIFPESVAKQVLQQLIEDITQTEPFCHEAYSYFCLLVVSITTEKFQRAFALLINGISCPSEQKCKERQGPVFVEAVFRDKLNFELISRFDFNDVSKIKLQLAALKYFTKTSLIPEWQRIHQKIVFLTSPENRNSAYNLLLDRDQAYESMDRAKRIVIQREWMTAVRNLKTELQQALEARMKALRF